MDKFLTIDKGDVKIEVINLEKATGEQAEEFKLILLKHIENDDIKLIVDIHQCDFLDSTFLSSLLIALKATIKKGGNLKLASPKHDVAEMLEATGMNRVFDIYSNIPDAIKSFDNN
jgi:anti-anti-sigma factor